MPLPARRQGNDLKVLGADVPFSFFPMRQRGRRWGLHSMLYASDPWAVIEGAIYDAKLASVELASALSFVRQSGEYFRAAERAGAFEVRPLLYYYSFLNLGKAISIARGRPNLVGKVIHGVGPVDAMGHTPNAAQLRFRRSTAGNPSALDELHWALENHPLTAGTVNVADLLAQSVVGHRMWVAGTGKKERFFAIEDIGWRHDDASHEIWLEVWMKKSSLKNRGRGVTETLKQSGLDPDFRTISHADASTHLLHVFEQSARTGYTSRPSDVVMDSVRGVRDEMWQTVTASPPYRKFYLYLSEPPERRLPQWMSVYSILFWLGSLTRYQPVELLDALRGPLGPFFHEFIETQPSQLLYLLTSELGRQDVSKPGIV